VAPIATQTRKKPDPGSSSERRVATIVNEQTQKQLERVQELK
jgi:hypothetical protein